MIPFGIARYVILGKMNNKYDLSILIPSRNEMFLARTVQEILEKKRGKTEIIVHLDGEWANPGIPDHPDVTIIYSPEAIGQRAGTNKACRLSRAKYVMKSDAHLAFDEGFDVKLMAAIEDDMTIVPIMKNLHAFDWVCIGQNVKSDTPYTEVVANGCGYSFYQGPTPEKCKRCGGNMERVLRWVAKDSPKSTSFTFDKTMHFQYFAEFKKRLEGQGELTPTMSLQGSCFMLTRKKYWELDICEENFGSWGQQGVEVACKTWFSGGRVMCLQSTWYAHMFRTQGGDFSFPYKQSQRQIEKAREYSRKQFKDGEWNKTIPGRGLDWLLKKFYPVRYWHDDEKKKGIIFYTDNQLNLKIAHKVQNALRKTGIPITSSSLKSMSNFGDNIHLPLERGIDTYFKQIIAALEKSNAEIVYMCEHDVIYHPSHFDFIPPQKDKFYYNQNFWRIRPQVDDLAVHWDANQVSGLIAYREYLLKWYKEKYANMLKNGFDRSYEPGGRDASQYEVFKSAYPNIDIRHDKNLTKSKWSLDDFRDKSTSKGWEESTIDKIPGWEHMNLRLFNS